MFAWCIQHYVPLRQFAKGEIHLAFYENFAENPKEEIVRLFSFLGKKFDDEVFAAIKRPSFVTRSGAPILTGQSVVASWKKDMTEQRARRALEITSLFGLDKIYGADPMPNIKAAYAQLGADKSTVPTLRLHSHTGRSTRTRCSAASHDRGHFRRTAQEPLRPRRDLYQASERATPRTAALRGRHPMHRRAFNRTSKRCAPGCAFAVKKPQRLSVSRAVGSLSR